MPDLEFDVHAGAARALGEADRIVAEHFAGARLQQQRRQPGEVAEQRRYHGIQEPLGADIAAAQQ